MTVRKGVIYAAEFDKLLVDIVKEANELQEYDGEHAQRQEHGGESDEATEIGNAQLRECSQFDGLVF